MEHIPRRPLNRTDIWKRLISPKYIDFGSMLLLTVRTHNWICYTRSLTICSFSSSALLSASFGLAPGGTGGDRRDLVPLILGFLFLILTVPWSKASQNRNIQTTGDSLLTSFQSYVCSEERTHAFNYVFT
jgi:hypothetical protein